MEYTVSAFSCTADLFDSARESFHIARDVLQWKNRPSPKSSFATIEVDYDGDDNTIISGWTEVESVVVVHHPSSRTYVSSDSSDGMTSLSSLLLGNKSTKRRGRSRHRSTS